MCGIAGIVGLDSDKYLKPLRDMSASIAHRGPDGKGEYLFSNCALAHRRLSIIDIEAGHQPMLSNNNKLGITFNGEIYGYKQIKKDLLKDQKFNTDSDTEVILGLYSNYKNDFLKYLPGMFSFALWDEDRQALICARDRFGEKPFFYAFGSKGEFIFASEIKAILASGLVKPKLRQASIAHYLQKLYVDPKHTIYENIYTLPPAHSLIYKNGKLDIFRYWNMPEINKSITLSDAISEFNRLLNSAIEKQLVADVSVGAFLSGGLDSSTIVAIASKYQKNLSTYSFGFVKGNNEFGYARSIAEKYDTEHFELNDSNSSIASLMHEMQSIYDEPFADSSNIPTYLISKFAAKQKKVVLSGDGGDELFGGYRDYRVFSNFSNQKAKLFWSSNLVYFLSKILSKSGMKKIDYFLNKSLAMRYAIQFNSVLESKLEQSGLFNNLEMRALNFGNFVDDYKPSWQQIYSLDDAMRVDVEKYMAGDILVKTDRASMAVGLEMRSPFLDWKFADFCLSLPSDFKIKQNEDKYILRKASGDLWTKKIRKRKKCGFGGSVNNWLLNSEMMDMRREYLNNKNSRIFSIMPFNEVKKIAMQNNYKTWSLLILSCWLESNHYI